MVSEDTIGLQIKKKRTRRMAAFSQLKTGKVAGVSRGMMGNGWLDTGS